MHATPRDDERVACRGQHGGGLGDARWVGAHAVERVAAEISAPRGGRPARRLFLEQILRTQQHRGTGPAARGCGKRHVHVIVDARQLAHAAHPFRARAEELRMIEVLERVPIALRAPHVLHQCDDGDGSLQRLGEPGHEKRRRRAVLAGHHAHLVRDARVAVRHRRARVLGSIGDLADAEFRRDEMQRRRQALAEHHLHAVPLERPRQNVRAAPAELVPGPSLSPRGSHLESPYCARFRSAERSQLARTGQTAQV